MSRSWALPPPLVVPRGTEHDRPRRWSDDNIGITGELTEQTARFACSAELAHYTGLSIMIADSFPF